jgi:putative flippase GtrA
MRDKIVAFIDFFHPLFRKIMPLQTFRYAVCGGTNVVLDLVLFFISFQFILHKEVLDLGFIVLKPYNAALIMAFIITFPTGFLMSKYIVWTASNLSGRVQLFRYFILVMTNFFLNYVMMMFFVEFLNFYPTLAKFLTIIIVVFYSYTSQKYFTFREKKA